MILYMRARATEQNLHSSLWKWKLITRKTDNRDMGDKPTEKGKGGRKYKEAEARKKMKEEQTRLGSWKSQGLVGDRGTITKSWEAISRMKPKS